MISEALAQDFGRYPGQEWMWGMMTMHGLGSLLFLVLLIVVVIVLIRVLVPGVGPASAPTAGPSALEILEQRYARGEVGRDEYQEKKKDLARGS